MPINALELMVPNFNMDLNPLDECLDG